MASRERIDAYAGAITTEIRQELHGRAGDYPYTVDDSAIIIRKRAPLYAKLRDNQSSWGNLQEAILGQTKARCLIQPIRIRYGGERMMVFFLQWSKEKSFSPTIGLELHNRNAANRHAHGR